MRIPVLILTVLSLCILSSGDDFSSKKQYQRMHKIAGNASTTHSRRSHALMRPGAVDLVPKYSLHGAVIVSDRSSGPTSDSAEVIEQKQKLLAARLENVHNLGVELPFPLTRWAAVFTNPCPLYPGGHKTERGLIWAHYRIFREFSFFDPILLARLAKYQNDSALIAENKPLYSKDGLYMAYPNGTLYKNNQPFLDQDIITIFEDDAEGAIVNMNTTIIEEFAAMKEDLLFLGWCEGRAAKPVPLCAHAYALTRRGARKLVQYLEPCGRALDEQFVILAKNNLITWRRAYGHSYKDLNEKYQNKYGEKTFGMFHQNKALGSINGHRRLLL